MCTNSQDTKDFDVTISAMCPLLLEGNILLDDMSLIVGENYELTVNPNTVFGATHTTPCPLIGTLKDEGCKNVYTGTGIIMSSSGADYTISKCRSIKHKAPNGRIFPGSSCF